MFESVVGRFNPFLDLSDVTERVKSSKKLHSCLSSQQLRESGRESQTSFHQTRRKRPDNYLDTIQSEHEYHIVSARNPVFSQENEVERQLEMSLRKDTLGGKQPLNERMIVQKAFQESEASLN